jgi:hypothetical protein
MVKVTSEQYAAIIGNRITASEHNIAAYLRETAPDGLAQVSDAQLLAFVRENTRAARELGIKTEKGLGRWCFLSMASGGKVNHNPAIRHAFANSGEPADSYLEKIMQQMLQAQGARRS